MKRKYQVVDKNAQSIGYEFEKQMFNSIGGSKEKELGTFGAGAPIWEIRGCTTELFHVDLKER